jgi:protein-tyrosine phosphatase
VGVKLATMRLDQALERVLVAAAGGGEQLGVGGRRSGAHPSKGNPAGLWRSRRRCGSISAVIDLHCHILAGIDDGAVDVEDSVAMAREGAADGIELICATPHIRHDHEVRIAELARRTADLNGELRRRGVAVGVIAAGEVAETEVEGLSDEELGMVALGGRWILLEPAPGPLADSLAAAVRTLRRRGYRSLIAHPERHAAPDMGERLAALVETGCLVQVTAALLAAGAASGPLLELARAGLVHVLGSDSHSARHGRRVRLSAGLARLREAAELRPHLEWIAREAPAAIVAGEDVESPLAVRA